MLMPERPENPFETMRDRLRREYVETADEAFLKSLVESHRKKEKKKEDSSMEATGYNPKQPEYDNSIV